MLEDSARDITADCLIDGRRLVIDGRLFRNGTPAFVVRLIDE